MYYASAATPPAIRHTAHTHVSHASTPPARQHLAFAPHIFAHMLCACRPKHLKLYVTQHIYMYVYIYIYIHTYIHTYIYYAPAATHLAIYAPQHIYKYITRSTPGDRDLKNATTTLLKFSLIYIMRLQQHI